MIMLVPVNTIQVEDDGSLDVNTSSTSSNDDFIRSARLKRSKSKSAKKKLEKLDSSQMRQLVEDQ